VRTRTFGLLVAVCFATASIHAGTVSAQPSNPWLTRRVLDIAHAGGEDEAPHETMYAYKRAAGLGAEVLEGDVRLTGDDVLVVHHDATVDATTDGTGRVDEKTYAELFALDHGYKFTPYQWSCGDCPVEDYVFRGVRTGSKPPPAGYVATDFTIPTAESLFTTFPDRFLDLEIKESGEPARRAADALIELVKRYDAAERVIFVSFDDEIVQYVRDQYPEAITSPGLDGVTAFYLTRQPQPQHAILQVPPTYGAIQVVDAQFVDDAHAAGLAVWVWMDTKEQESEAFYQQLLDWGVDGILGSRPGLARELIDRNGLTWLSDTPDPDPDAPGPNASRDASGSAPSTAAGTTPRFTG
jgi:glycerophosphoryl diester phosphodiesterase